MNVIRWVLSAALVLLLGLTLWQLEAPRQGLSIERTSVGQTPVIVYQDPEAGPAPAVVIAHGFAGSQQLMEAYALTLANAGYVVVSFDFEGHGRNPVPMSGDVTQVTGTTQLLMDETGRVSDFALSLPRADGRLALLGHSMASDVIVRQTIADSRVGATVAISMFSEAVTEAEPNALLAITGEWEGFLRQEADRVLKLIDASAAEGETALNDSVIRRAVVAPSVEHVGVLYSGTGLREARAWLDQRFERASGNGVAAIGGWIALGMVSLLALALTLPVPIKRMAEPPVIARNDFFWALGLASVLTPLLLAPVDLRFLPVLVADYLALHLLIFGLIVLSWLRVKGWKPGGISWLAAATVVVFGTLLFGEFLDRYVASFWPIAERLPIILAIAAGAVPFMIADAALTQAGEAPLWRRLTVRTAFLLSLGAAVVLDFERLFFLLIILPVIILYFVVFGLVGGRLGRASGSVLGVGIGLGLVLAWSLGVTFPMFDAG